ncbi:MAG: hypothetical protein JSU89_12550 [Myxococcales bacterium]|nr:MAG: hypothetical protein JSU89_12550 [Myxococcales bacterium]
MQAKLKPGDTFKKEVGGITYEIAVMSVGEVIDAEQQLSDATDEQTVIAHYKAWLSIATQFVKGWDHKRPIEEMRYVLDRDGLGDLLNAILAGNSLSEDDAKN